MSAGTTVGAPASEREVPFTTLSGDPIAPLYTEADLPSGERIGLHASEGEIIESLQQIWGDYREAPVF